MSSFPAYLTRVLHPHFLHNPVCAVYAAYNGDTQCSTHSVPFKEVSVKLLLSIDLLKEITPKQYG